MATPAGRRLRSGHIYQLGIGGPLRSDAFNLREVLPIIYASRHAKEDLGDYQDEEVELEEPRESISFPDIELSQNTPASPSVPTILSNSTPLTPQQKKNKKKDGRRRMRRVEEARRRQQDPMNHPKRISIQRAITSQPLRVEIDVSTLPVTRQGWTGKRQALTPGLQLLWRNLQILEHGMTIVDWDGRTCYAILDAEGRIITLLGGTPKDLVGWSQAISDATRGIANARTKMKFTLQQLSHRRGDFAAISSGISFGSGQQRVGNLRIIGRDNQAAMAELLKNPGVRRISGFANSLFQTFFHKSYKQYHSTLSALVGANPLLHPNFPGKSVFAATTFNMGPTSFSPPHTDEGNDATGQCAITALGDFDPDKGGHLVMWNLRLIIRFPPGATILLPSSLVTHSNIPVQPHETRYSIIQYSAGALACWVYNGHQSDKSWLNKATPDQLRQRKEDRKRRWEEALDRFTSWDDLVAGNWQGLETYLSGDMSDLSDEDS